MTPTKEMIAGGLGVLLAVWVAASWLGEAEPARPLPAVPPPERAAPLLPEEVPLLPLVLRNDGAARLAGRNPFAATDPWLPPLPDPMPPPPLPPPERTLPIATLDSGRVVLPRAPVRRGLPAAVSPAAAAAPAEDGAEGTR
ncbi:MAG: hypothetical protein KatS3mg102_0572 [Planctomycetota bacterium]|nr:MAG: hypothetical protein KatS3mg102_0572 [Planctomycetota bacterium]